MAAYELVHPLGRDLEKIHGALLAGADKMLSGGEDGYTEKLFAQFHDPFENGGGFSRLKLANWATKRLVWIEYSVFPENESDWYVDWGAGLERSFGRISVRDILFRDFITGFSDKVPRPEKIVFDMTEEGVAITLFDGKESETHFGSYEGEVYSRIECIARAEAGLDELVILADAA